MIRHVAWVVALSAIGWVAVITLVPLLPASVAGPLYLFSSLLCHQQASRSFHWGATQWLVCARCTGLYVGGAIGALIWMSRGVGIAGPPDVASLQSGQVRQIAAAVAVPTLATLVLEWTLWDPGNLFRALAATPLGAFLVLLVLSAFAVPRGVAPMKA